MPAKVLKNIKRRHYNYGGILLILNEYSTPQIIKPSVKIIVTCACVALLALHVTMLLIYAQPFKPVKNKFTYLSQAYAYPYFHQNWNLFAPVPASNYKLFVKDEAGHATTDIFNELLLKHQSNRFAGYGPLLIAFSNSIHYFETNTVLTEKLNGPVRNDLYFSMLEHEVNSYWAHIKKTKVQQLKLILVVEDIQAKTQRVYFN